jgi:4-hydroxy-3-polyprenylbenzoate decarboxylase
MREKGNDLRNYLNGLETAGLFKWVDKEVDKDWEVGAITRLVFSGVSEQHRYSIGFSRIRGYAGMRVVAGVVGEVASAPKHYNPIPTCVIDVIAAL